MLKNRQFATLFYDILSNPGISGAGACRVKPRTSELKRSNLFWRLRAWGLAAGLLAVPVLAAGCSVPKLNPFGAGKDEYAGPPPDQLTTIAQNDGHNGTLPGGMGANCPQVVAWPRERLVTIYQPGHVGDTLFAVHRGEITKMSRECQFHGGRVVVKYGVAGRVQLGPKGHPGAVTLPVSVRAAGPGQVTLASDRMNVSATIPAGAPVGYFSLVREVSFPIQVGTRPEDYKIFIAFERNHPNAG
jgi:hypothetical protein